MAEDFLKSAKEGKIENFVLIVEEKGEWFHLTNNEMSTTHAIGMAEVAKKMIFESAVVEE